VSAGADSLQALEALETFLGAMEERRHTVKKNPRIFISHKLHTKDNAYAERVAYLATLERLDYWLDLHDPVLLRANRQPFTGPQKAVLIAGIIEIALLNCTSVIAVHTDVSAQSKWIPDPIPSAVIRHFVDSLSGKAGHSSFDSCSVVKKERTW
jgi:hypothetical protein